MSLMLQMFALLEAGGATLTLNSLASSDIDIFAPFSSSVGIKVKTDGDVQEKNASGAYVSQNPGVEWTDDGGATASQYEAQLTKISGFTPDGPALASYHTISSDLTWDKTSTVEEIISFSGTLSIREIADTGNEVSASVLLAIENGSP